MIFISTSPAFELLPWLYRPGLLSVFPEVWVTFLWGVLEMFMHGAQGDLTRNTDVALSNTETQEPPASPSQPLSALMASGESL